MIKETAFIENSVIDETVDIYNHTRVINSDVHKNVVIADFARVYNSKMYEFSRAERNNIITHSNIGKYTYFGMNTIVSHTNIGNFCSVSWGVTIGPPNHDYNRVTTHEFLYNDKYNIKPKKSPPPYERYGKGNTIIENDVWIGANAVIANGVRIGNGAVVGANAMVTKDIPPYAIAVGNPAKIIKFRFKEEQIEQLLEIKWWEFSVDFIKENFNLFASEDIDSFISIMKKHKRDK